MNPAWFLIWVLLHSVSILVVSYLVEMLKISDPFWTYLALAAGVTSLANIYRALTRNKPFIINSLFIFWLVFNAFIIWIITLLCTKVGIGDRYVTTAIIGLGLTISSYLVYFFHLLRLRGVKIWIAILLMVAFLYFVNTQNATNSVEDTLSKLIHINVNGQTNGKTENKIVEYNTDQETNRISQKIDEIVNPKPISQKTQDVESAIFKHTNAEREANGRSTLRLDTVLTTIARDHSLDMVERSFFAHDNLEGETPTDRAVRQGYNVHKELANGWYSDGIAENIGKMPTGNIQGGGYVANNADSIGQAQTQSWMESPGHRANILNSEYTLIGVGCAYDGLYYVCTQDFK